MGNQYSVVREQEEEAEFNRLLEDVERAERLRSGYEPYRPHTTTGTTDPDVRFVSDNNYGRQLGTLNQLRGIYHHGHLPQVMNRKSGTV